MHSNLCTSCQVKWDTWFGGWNGIPGLAAGMGLDLAAEMGHLEGCCLPVRPLLIILQPTC